MQHKAFDDHSIFVQHEEPAAPAFARIKQTMSGNPCQNAKYRITPERVLGRKLDAAEQSAVKIRRLPFISQQNAWPLPSTGFGATRT